MVSLARKLNAGAELTSCRVPVSSVGPGPGVSKTKMTTSCAAAEENDSFWEVLSTCV